jgi:hypothetical protein
MISKDLSDSMDSVTMTTSLMPTQQMMSALIAKDKNEQGVRHHDD